jgi:uncharacterized protein YyaL (SSP411 family)
MTEALLALDFFLDVPLEIALVWPGDAFDANSPLAAVLRATFLPSRALAGAAEPNVAAAAKVVSFMRGKVAVGGQPTAYVCRRGACQLPATEAAQLQAQLRSDHRG